MWVLKYFHPVLLSSSLIFSTLTKLKSRRNRIGTLRKRENFGNTHKELFEHFFFKVWVCVWGKELFGDSFAFYLDLFRWIKLIRIHLRDVSNVFAHTHSDMAFFFHRFWLFSLCSHASPHWECFICLTLIHTKCSGTNCTGTQRSTRGVLQVEMDQNEQWNGASNNNNSKTKIQSSARSESIENSHEKKYDAKRRRRRRRQRQMMP